jgi:hypothetical protein
MNWFCFWMKKLLLPTKIYLNSKFKKLTTKQTFNLILHMLSDSFILCEPNKSQKQRFFFSFFFHVLHLQPFSPQFKNPSKTLDRRNSPPSCNRRWLKFPFSVAEIWIFGNFFLLGIAPISIAVSRVFLGGWKWEAERKKRRLRKLLGVLWSFRRIEDVSTVIVW